MSATKMLTCRVPLEFYIKLVTDASENKMTLTDLVLMRLYSNSSAKFSDGGMQKMETVHAKTGHAKIKEKVEDFDKRKWVEIEPDEKIFSDIKIEYILDMKQDWRDKRLISFNNRLPTFQWNMMRFDTLTGNRIS